MMASCAAFQSTFALQLKATSVPKIYDRITIVLFNDKWNNLSLEIHLDQNVQGFIVSLIKFDRSILCERSIVDEMYWWWHTITETWLPIQCKSCQCLISEMIAHTNFLFSVIGWYRSVWILLHVKNCHILEHLCISVYVPFLAIKRDPDPCL